LPRLLRTLLATALVATLPAGAAAVAPARSAVVPGAASLYGSRGAWLDIFAGATWTHADAAVAALKAHGVETLYLQTGNYSRHADVVRPRLLGAWLDAAHAAGIAVVAWYLPSFVDPALDARRASAAIRFRSRAGGRFDGFALDIEANLVPPRLRNERLLALAARIRRAATAAYPLGAIIPSPVGMQRHPHYWPRFPYRQLASSFDAFLPMAYFSYHVHRPADAFVYTRRVVTMIRRHTNPDVLIHLIGGVANHLTPATVGAFVRAAGVCGISGYSLYAYPQTSAAEWAALDTASPAGGTAACG
jgi:hypothetical protein